jgi:hypothetical protein
MNVLIRLFLFVVCLLCLLNGAPARACLGLSDYERELGATFAYDDPSNSTHHYDCLCVSAAGEQDRPPTSDRVIFGEFGEFVAAKDTILRKSNGH